MKPPIEPFRFHPYRRPAAGWGALRSVAHTTRASQQALKNLLLLLRINHHGGFDCPSCAWGEAPDEGRIRFCENGAKATNWEATSRRVDAAFFRENSITDLLRHTDYWLEFQGRLTEPMYFDSEGDHYRPISWDAAFELVGRHLNALASADEAAFYTSGRASNEVAFLYQLFARVFGTNNLPDCSNMCHEASGYALKESIGVGKGTCTYEDLEQADTLFIFGQNPGSNAPRMLDPVSRAVKRGAQVVAINPLREAGLQRFQAPQNPVEMLTDGATPTSSAYFRPALGGDMAVARGVAKILFERQERADNDGGAGPLDLEFIREHCNGFGEYRELVTETPWEHILQQSGLKKEELEQIADIYARGKRVIFCWGMGITQHYHGVATIQELTNLLLLRGQIGRPGCGASPIRGHSNVQGDRTMGINERPAADFLDSLEKRFGFSCPREPGVNVVQGIGAMIEGRIKVFIGLGGNFAQATPDSQRTHEALRSCDLTVQISTKLNRSHLVTGREALILPCLGRTDIDEQAAGPQAVTVEDTFSMVHASYGQLRPLSSRIRSECAIVAGIANATVGSEIVDWLHLVEDYSRIRDLIESVIPGFDDFNRRIGQPGGFYLQNAAAKRHWKTASGQANFKSNPLLDSLVRSEMCDKGERRPDLLLQTMRSHDQFNTTVYSPNDRYRGITGSRQVLFANREDISRLGFSEGQRVDIVSLWDDDVDRRVEGFTLVAYDIPPGQAAAYYPETNPLVPLENYGIGSFTPASKLVGVCLEESAATERIL
ncbi:FdhF/YdeP family oxidoreductase [Microbulbifer zhoushanensis]|uniref:FdhF/YdeP family oxidoreductase n=1 Tax=Microbulbifer zhoushanensis TaxID=2904254 RepID=UPI001F00190D|nr:FdhF/YdeP family oxidoreductase [Microbulbifer zhoushanensis]